jgi:pilus assembly protein Flp/PilA
MEYPMLRSAANVLVEFLKREDGPTAVEYAVLLALIIAVCLVAITVLGQRANQTFDHLGDTLAAGT